MSKIVEKNWKMVAGVMSMSAMLVVPTVSVLAEPVTTEGSYTVTIQPNGTETVKHLYGAYQVFSGELEEIDGVTYLSDISWGKGISDGAAMLADLKASTEIAFQKAGTNIFAQCKNAADVAEILGQQPDKDTGFAKAFAEFISGYLSSTYTVNTSGSDEITPLSAGYYLIKDLTENLENSSDSYSRYLLKVVKDTTVVPKSSVPTVEKKVQENNASGDGGYGIGYNDFADYNIGDTVPFELIGTVASTYADYKSYYYSFKDTLEKERFDTSKTKESVKVYLLPDGTDVSAIDKNEVTDITDSFSVVVDDNKISVTCDDIKKIKNLNTSSKIIVRYDAILDSDAEIGQLGNLNGVYLQFSNNPNTDQGGYGQTPEDYVLVFTYELDANKKDADTGLSLENVEFQVYRKLGDVKQYVMVDSENRVVGWGEKDKGTVLRSDKDGKIQVIGLDAGTYYIEETKELPGYNKMEDVKIVITAKPARNVQNWTRTDTESRKEGLTELTIAVNDGTEKAGTLPAGIVTTDILNQKGATLPETGGTGTTMFYLAGGILAGGAGVLLIARKRTKANK